MWGALGEGAVGVELQGAAGGERGISKPASVFVKRARVTGTG
jgi:hypothetical protein